MENRTDVYVDGDREAERYVNHFVLRAVEPERVAQFYRDVFDLLETEKPADDPNCYLTDGRVTPDHLAVEDLRLCWHRHRTPGAGAHRLQGGERAGGQGPARGAIQAQPPT